MTNLLDLVPAFKRQLGTYQSSDLTDSGYAAYLADATQALMLRWNRDYSVTFTPPNTYVVNPDIAQRDIRPIVLMASIIYKVSSGALASIQDGDFSYNPLKGASNTIELDRAELISYLGNAVRLAPATTAPLMGYAYVYNKEAYFNFLYGGWITDGII